MARTYQGEIRQGAPNSSDASAADPGNSRLSKLEAIVGQSMDRTPRKGPEAAATPTIDISPGSGALEDMTSKSSTVSDLRKEPSGVKEDVASVKHEVSHAMGSVEDLNESDEESMEYTEILYGP